MVGPETERPENAEQMSRPGDDGGPDIFERPDLLESETERAANGEATVGTSSSDDVQLPVELASLSDRFVESLSARVHTLPPSIERISSLFQDFYIRTDSHIATHISTLASRINRDGSPSKSSSASTQQMLTVSEIAERRKARKQLPLKQLALEETVEKRVCEKVYDKIWRHKSSLDEVRDEKLRSKTAALSLLGMGLKDLGIEVPDANEEKEKDANTRLSAAGSDLEKMNDARYPLGKLQHLISAHKAIVDALTVLLGSSSSADEILPALIYTLITSPPEGINVISNLLFIQRFRAVSKINGESAYCLTNLEAAISFLESVDLSSLSTDAPTDGQPRLLNAATTPPTELSSSVRAPRSGKDTLSGTFPRTQLSAPAAQQRRLSNLFQPPAKVLGAANDAVRNTADQGLKNISNTLDNSFNFLFGRLKEMQNNRGANEQPLVPKTLDEARRLVTNPPGLNEGDSVNDESSTPELREGYTQRSTLMPEDRRYSGRDGRRTPRDRSADSTRSSEAGSNQRASAIPTGRLNSTSTPSPSAGASIFNSSPVTPLESMKNFGNSFNPLNHIPGMIRGFGRNAPETPSASTTATTGTTTPSTAGGTILPERPRLVSTSRLADARSSPLTTSTSTVPFPPAPLSQSDPPIQRFLEVDDPQDLRIGDVAELLQDYKRLAAMFVDGGSRE
ncbi:VPS9 domain protein, putative [Talaromyces stipitatus ATCC 10500]|uniref:VPS9 domain protein, putative n=1 Tax=Talaromyces stipitatus (strain ATCC 10500 / CBS 375.48 / QM 6759 / NRRL 1006) TaxID=441959 RepID=B8M8P4_TALSN|nr:VPS9 domain protein, putative [Talaromyces stipitatus ATCC 10500]EED20557.1 VPS9 domain protein, putative [Talaromyces stipitatus ATCC 10500]